MKRRAAGGGRLGFYTRRMKPVPARGRRALVRAAAVVVAFTLFPTACLPVGRGEHAVAAGDCTVGGVAYSAAAPHGLNVVDAPVGRVVEDGHWLNTFEGTDHADLILGTPESDVIQGLGGDDVICGGGGNDELLGDEGDDTLVGGGGNDACDGGSGTDAVDACEVALGLP